MKTQPECLPCFLKQAQLAAGRVSGDPALAFRAMQAVSDVLPSLAIDRSPGENATLVFRAAADFLGVGDPYRDEKRRYNALALDAYNALKAAVDAAPDALSAALRVAAAGNALDLNILGDVDLPAVVRQTQALTWAIDHSERLRADLERAERILYLVDNAGEIVFDRVLIEVLPSDRVTVAVKSGPIANDVTLADAQQVGLHRVARVIETGTSYFGTPLAHCSAEFRAEFAAADVIIAKGMANFETLDDVSANLYFVLKVKCPVVEQAIGAAVGDLVLLAQGERG